ncbi:dihydrolipoamide acetyltransferase family protein [Amnibacterium sp.]|uniref:dihydrolipoamide acetyltransferase family protein n=1 Tax=Amnibacterium sp. TaxID=1872496 RepID=UPI002628B052|nr:dihydrolipoamide acetyltransferase family protein [Amnibacterium sp.]MCU1473272.1 pyruvate dehydrogenase complex dihydrolipoamide acetyltransferase [Amnibacterium sp.]
MATVVRMPEVLAGASEAAIQSWLVTPGQSIGVGEPLAEVETEKAVVEYAAETEGVVLELLVSEGQPVAVGEPIAIIGAADEATRVREEPGPADGSQQRAPEPETAPDPEPSPLADAPDLLPSERGGHRAAERRFASPIVRRLARERGIDLALLTGTGPDGRIVRRDLEATAAGQGAAASETRTPTGSPKQPAPSPAVQAGPGGPPAAFVDLPLSGMRRAIARRLTESKTTIPHFYVVADCRVDGLLDLRRQLNAFDEVHISVNDLVVKAAAGALMDVPEANVAWAGTAVRRFATADVAMAVAVPNGLVTPVLRGVESMSLTQVSAAAADLVARAKAGRLKQHELEGGSFAISNLGMYGVKEFSAIINPPQAGILAVGAVAQRPVVDDGALGVGSVMTVTLSADHRVIDGAVAARWTAAFVQRIEEPLRLLL